MTAPSPSPSPVVLVGLRYSDTSAHLVAESACRSDRRRGLSGTALCGAACAFVYHGRVEDSDLCPECRGLHVGVPRQTKLF